MRRKWVATSKETLTGGTDANSQAIKLDWRPNAGNERRPARRRRTASEGSQSSRNRMDSVVERERLKSPTESELRPLNKGCTDDPGDRLSPVFAI